MENWKNIPSYPLYQASDQGRIRRIFKTKHVNAIHILKPYRHKKTGYFTVPMSDGHSRKTITVHRLITETFFGIRPIDKVVNHIDGDKSNNSILNLEYVTKLENEKHASIHGLKACWERNRHSKLTKDDVDCLRAQRMNGASYASLGRMFSISDVQAKRIVEFKRWKELNTGESWHSE